ncbi:MAG TPA: type II 3-dehydroquinate dehydratase [Dehalococcoidia bacterium]|nr:type II 3-dehydroquinate dehydratase [Dehalococcoidia bacterium]
MRIIVVNGPNLNLLGSREPEVYGSVTLAEIEARLAGRASELEVELHTYQSNHEGALVDFLQEEGPQADGIIINPGALTHYGLSLRDALAACGRPIIEVHLSNIHGREPFRRRSVTAAVARGVIAGLGWRGYLAALDILVGMLKDEATAGETARPAG